MEMRRDHRAFHGLLPKKGFCLWSVSLGPLRVHWSRLPEHVVPTRQLCACLCVAMCIFACDPAQQDALTPPNKP